MNIVSLFSGAGGLDLGFVQAGHHIVWANDIFEDAVSTYKKNIGNHIVDHDINEVDSSEIPSCDMVMGGFPCQGFSVANTKRCVEDVRNTLYLQLLRVIRDKQPKFFLAENVKGILSLEKGLVFNRIMSDFSELNYRVEYRLLNAADYGVPQKRERVIIVGVRKDVDFQFHYPDSTHSRFGGDGKIKWMSVLEALKDIGEPDVDGRYPNHVGSNYKLIFNGYIGHRQLAPDEPAPTVTARGDSRGGVVILPHPNGKRRMTCRELSTIQSFPLDYEFVGSTSSIYRQIGNAVPPRLSFCIASCFPK